MNNNMTNVGITFFYCNSESEKNSISISPGQLLYVKMPDEQIKIYIDTPENKRVLIAGLKGDQGIQGKIGPIGPQGEPGKDGKNGAPGPAGKNGATGPKGANGIAGPAGKDATINGVNTLTLVEGNNIILAQQGNTLTISSPGSSGNNNDGISQEYIDKELNKKLDVSWVDDNNISPTSGWTSKKIVQEINKTNSIKLDKPEAPTDTNSHTYLLVYENPNFLFKEFPIWKPAEGGY